MNGNMMNNLPPGNMPPGGGGISPAMANIGLALLRNRIARGRRVAGYAKGTSKLTAKQRQALPRSSFALPGQGTGPKGAGAGSYPIPDISHARNALARV